jgi:hypothetical protein
VRLLRDGEPRDRAAASRTLADPTTRIPSADPSPPAARPCRRTPGLAANSPSSFRCSGLPVLRLRKWPAAAAVSRTDRVVTIVHSAVRVACHRFKYRFPLRSGRALCFAQIALGRQLAIQRRTVLKGASDVALPLPKSYAPMDARLVDVIPNGAAWQYEPK